MISHNIGSQKSAPSRINKENVSLKSKGLLVGGQNAVLNCTTTRSTETTACHESANDCDCSILCEEVEAGIRAQKNGKVDGVDNILAELIKAWRGDSD